MDKGEIVKTLFEERSYQDSKWGGKDHDSKQSIGDFIIYMEQFLNEAKFHYTGPEEARIDVLHCLRKVTALGIACFEVHGVPKRNF
jgi:hypothetical protein